MTILTSKMKKLCSVRVSNPIIISRKGKGVVHEKSVKMQLLQIILKINTHYHTWTEIILAKYQPPHFKNEREQLRVRQQSHHYIKKI